MAASSQISARNWLWLIGINWRKALHRAALPSSSMPFLESLPCRLVNLPTPTTPRVFLLRLL
ncbi:hypothetical protein [Rhodoferax sp.]|uniref:hypothetical protein n=1 Tax=Rhodoferax sp. TaxID=50421 RepID=UPI00261D16DA|nr:hypothetical protein [Rhodoferax sp.]